MFVIDNWAAMPYKLLYWVSPRRGLSPGLTQKGLKKAEDSLEHLAWALEFTSLSQAPCMEIPNPTMV